MAMVQLESIPDEGLADFIRAGHSRAFDVLITRHHKRFYHMAYRWLLNAEDAEDVVQQCFLKLWSGQATWKSGKKATFTTWFYTILYNQSMDVLRRHKRSFVELNEQLVAADEDQEHEAIQHQESQRIHHVLSGLPDNQRIAIQLFYFEQMKQKDMAQVMGLSVKALESILVRAKQNLREQLGDEVIDGVAYG